VDNLENDLKLTLNENGRRESLLPKEEVKICIASFSVWLTNGGGKISLTKNMREHEFIIIFKAHCKRKILFLRKKFP